MTRGHGIVGKALEGVVMLADRAESVEALVLTQSSSTGMLGAGTTRRRSTNAC